MDVLQIYSSCVNLEFYFGNWNLIWPSIFDNCAMFVNCLTIAIDIRVCAYWKSRDTKDMYILLRFARLAQVCLSLTLSKRLR